MPVLVLGNALKPETLRRIEFDAGEFSSEEGIAIEKATGLTWQEWMDSALPNLPTTKIVALKALVWMCRRRNGEPDLQFTAVSFPMGEVDWDLDDETRARIEKEIAVAAAAAGDGNPPEGDGADEPSPTRSGPAPSVPRKRSTGSRPRKATSSPARATGTG